MQRIIIVGCGGFGREVHDVIDAINLHALESSTEPVWDLVGYLDDSPTPVNVALVEARGLRVSDDLAAFVETGASHYVIGVGAGATRKRIATRLDAAGLKAAVLVHPNSTAGDGVDLGGGTVVCAGVRVTTNIQIGSHVHLNINATVGHDCVLDDFVTVNPLAAISGNVGLRSFVTIGTNASVLQGLSVGENSVVGAGACVVKDVPSNVVAVGIPAKWKDDGRAASVPN